MRTISKGEYAGRHQIKAGNEMVQTERHQIMTADGIFLFAGNYHQARGYDYWEYDPQDQYCYPATKRKFEAQEARRVAVLFAEWLAKKNITTNFDQHFDEFVEHFDW